MRIVPGLNFKLVVDGHTFEGKAINQLDINFEPDRPSPVLTVEFICTDVTLDRGVVTAVLRKET